MKRKVVDGGLTGVKLNKFRHSKFELDSNNHEKKIEQGETSNTQGWDEYYYSKFGGGQRNHGGSLKDHDGSHFEDGALGYIRSDDSIRLDVLETLNLMLKDEMNEISFYVYDSTVHLSGYLRDELMRENLINLIKNISGVSNVKSDIICSKS